MSRIRSVHPGLWTDEAFMSLSAHARLLFIGIWTEAFDDGVFEWKPLTLKARIFPVDTVDVPALLAELVANDCIAERGKYGLIRNFRHYQRPKKPNSSGLLQADDHEYVGLVPNQFPTGSEEVEQMEDGGGVKEEEEKNTPPSPQGGGEGALFDDLLEAFPRSLSSKLDKAERWFTRQPVSDQRAMVAAAKAFSAWWWPEQRRKGRSEAEAIGYAPPLHSWLIDGAWKSVGEIQTVQPVEPMVKLDRERDAALWLACEQVQGKKAPTSDTQWSFRQSVVEQARASLQRKGAA